MQVYTYIEQGSLNMLEFELQQYLLREYPQENARCEWKEFKKLKN